MYTSCFTSAISFISQMLGNPTLQSSFLCKSGQSTTASNSGRGNEICPATSYMKNTATRFHTCKRSSLKIYKL